MATSTGRSRCIKCGKDKATAKCSGCKQEFCLNHLIAHRQELSQELDEIEVNRDIFRETLNQQTNHHLLIQQINQWEYDSIERIKQTAEEARHAILKPTAKNSTKKIEEELNELTNELRQGRLEDDITEIDLQKWKERLEKLTGQLTKSSNVIVRHSSKPLITCIHVDNLSQSNISNIPNNAKWFQTGITIAGGNGQGNSLYQMYYPNGIYVDDTETFYIADYGNHRIVEWKKGTTTGQVVAGGNGAGSQNNQLNCPWNVIVDRDNDSLIISDYGNRRVVRWPRQNGTRGEVIIPNVSCTGLAMDSNGYLYVSDNSAHEVRRWKIGETKGTLVAGGNGQGNRLDQLSTPYYIYLDEDRSVYISDQNNFRVVKWMNGAKEGIVVAGGQGQGNRLTQLYNPRGIVVDQLGTVYVADFYNHRIMRWLKGAKEGSIVVGGNGPGIEANQLYRPSDLTFNRQNNLCVVDRDNHRVQEFHGI